MLRSRTRLLTFALVLAACGGTPEKAPMNDNRPTPASPPAEPTTEAPEAPATARPDPHSFGRPDQVRVAHVGLDLRVDFDNARLEGTALLLVDRIDESAPLHLDVRGLEISSVETAKAGVKAEPELELVAKADDLSFASAEFAVEEGDPALGDVLRVVLRPEDDVVRVVYRTGDKASGLQWLDPEQTAGGTLPFLYSQNQAIHGRTWIPSQDSPGVRTTFDARITVDERFVALMAAESLGEEAAGAGGRRYRFRMPQPIPTYLFALAVGDLAKQDVGERTAVWADPKVLEAAAHEFGEMEQMLVSAEGLYGPYRWGRYDLLVLPPAFPFGGMENPRLTFATPTILAGDRSLVSLVAHELAHSWSGNLVTNQTWDDLWLNEGFTVYFERRIVEAIYGPERAEMEALIGRNELEAELAGELAETPDDQRLRVDLSGRDPDDNFSSIPYEKGALLLRHLEETYGREVFDEFLRKWFDGHAFGSVDTDEFVQVCKRELIDAHQPLEGKSAPNLDAWIHEPGLPEVAPQPDSDALELVEKAAASFASGDTKARALKTSEWSPWEWLHFLRSLPEDLGTEKMSELDAAFSLTESTNSEVLDQWLVMSATNAYGPADAAMEKFLVRVGRRKFLTPVYRALAATPEGKVRAKEIYRKARPGYHAISRGTLDDLLGVTD